MAKRYGNDQSKTMKQYRAVRAETDNPAIINDVVDTEFGVIPAGLKEKQEDQVSTQINDVVRDSVDGKTWFSIRNRKKK